MRPTSAFCTSLSLRETGQSTCFDVGFVQLQGLKEQVRTRAPCAHGVRFTQVSAQSAGANLGAPCCNSPSAITGVGPGAVHHLQMQEKGLEFNDLAYGFASFCQAGSSKLSEYHSREEHERS